MESTSKQFADAIDEYLAACGAAQQQISAAHASNPPPDLVPIPPKKVVDRVEAAWSQLSPMFDHVAADLRSAGFSPETIHQTLRKFQRDFSPATMARIVPMKMRGKVRNTLDAAPSHVWAQANDLAKDVIAMLKEIPASPPPKAKASAWEPDDTDCRILKALAKANRAISRPVLKDTFGGPDLKTTDARLPNLIEAGYVKLIGKRKSISITAEGKIRLAAMPEIPV